MTERNRLSAAEAFRQLEVDAKVLKTISETYPETSAEFQAVRRASMALTYVVMHDHEQFAAFVREMDGDLSDRERDELRDRYGIET